MAFEGGTRVSFEGEKVVGRWEGDVSGRRGRWLCQGRYLDCVLATAMSLMQQICPFRARCGDWTNRLKTLILCSLAARPKFVESFLASDARTAFLSSLPSLALIDGGCRGCMYVECERCRAVEL